MAVLSWIAIVVAIASALGVIAARNPLHSAMGLIVNLLSVAALYALMNAPFLAMAQVVVYSGAVMVLLLFAMLLLDVKFEASKSGERWIYGGSGVVFALFCVAILPVVMVAGAVRDSRPGTVIEGSVRIIGRRVFGEDALLFQAAGVVILVALIGSVMIGWNSRGSRVLPRDSDSAGGKL